jgi:hypothetical protein
MSLRRINRRPECSASTWRTWLPRDSTLADEVPLARTKQQAIDNKVRAFSGLASRQNQKLVVASFSINRNAQGFPRRRCPMSERCQRQNPTGARNLATTSFQRGRVCVRQRRLISPSTEPLKAGRRRRYFSSTVMDDSSRRIRQHHLPDDASYYNNPTDIDGNAHVIMLFTGRSTS